MKIYKTWKGCTTCRTDVSQKKVLRFYSKGTSKAFLGFFLRKETFIRFSKNETSPRKKDLHLAEPIIFHDKSDRSVFHRFLKPVLLKTNVSSFNYTVARYPSTVV